MTTQGQYIAAQGLHIAGQGKHIAYVGSVPCHHHELSSPIFNSGGRFG